MLFTEFVREMFKPAGPGAEVVVHRPQSGFLAFLDRIGLDRAELVNLVVRAVVAGGLSWWLIRYMLKHIDPTSTAKEDAKKKSEALLARLGLRPSSPLNQYELQIATALVVPSGEVTFEDIGGAEELIAHLQDQVLVPLSLPRSSLSSLVGAPKGVLLYGPPGCGKTLMARAVAKAAGASFINLDISIILDKWYGESQKLASAVFTLAAKLQPTIVFIDEMDAFLRSRTSRDHEATANVKAQFMALWDGFCTDKGHRIVVMGATNRPRDIDAAFLRRLPCRFHVRLPTAAQRAAILRVTLRHERMPLQADLAKVAAATDAFSGSDLQELCRLAVTRLLRDLRQRGVSLDSPQARATPLTQAHFDYAIAQQTQAKALDRFEEDVLD